MSKRKGFESDFGVGISDTSGEGGGPETVDYHDQYIGQNTGLSSGSGAGTIVSKPPVVPQNPNATPHEQAGPPPVHPGGVVFTPPPEPAPMPVSPPIPVKPPSVVDKIKSNKSVWAWVGGGIAAVLGLAFIAKKK